MASSLQEHGVEVAMLVLPLTWITLAHAGPVDGSLPVGRHVDQVVLRNTRGDVRVVVDPEVRRPIVVAREAHPGPACAVDAVTDGRRVEISAGPRQYEAMTACWTDFEVTLAPDDSLQLDLGRGTVEVPLVAGPVRARVGEGAVRVGEGDGRVTVELGQGELTLGRLTGEVQAHVDQGSITGNPAGLAAVSVGLGKIELVELVGGLDADISVGNIHATWAVAPTAPIDVNAGDGHIVLDLPDGTTIRPQLTTWSGTKSCELPTGEGTEVYAVASIGSIRLR